VRKMKGKVRNFSPSFFSQGSGNMNTSTDWGAYVLGILWGTTSPIGGTGFWVRHKERWFTEVVRRCFGIRATPHKTYSATGDQYRLKIVRAADVSVINQLLTHHGWAKRQAEERPYPSGPINDRGFIRAWVELHACPDVAHIGRTRSPTARLRIYGNRLLIETINCTIAAATGLQPRTLQNTPNDITKALYYLGQSYKAVVDWLYEDVELAHPERKDAFWNVYRQSLRERS